MQRQPLGASQRDRIAVSVPFVESLARRVASSMPGFDGVARFLANKGDHMQL